MYVAYISSIYPHNACPVWSRETVPLISSYSYYEFFWRVPFKLGTINEDEGECRTQFSSRTENFLDFPPNHHRRLILLQPPPPPPPLQLLQDLSYLFLNLLIHGTPCFLGCYERDWTQVIRQQKSVDLFHYIPSEALRLRGLRVNNEYPNICRVRPDKEVNYSSD